jgi:hypothetical protein
MSSDAREAREADEQEGQEADARAALAARITSFQATGYAGVLLDDRALIEVAVLRAVLGWPPSGPAPPAADIRRGLDAVVTAGTFLWLRAQVLPQADRLDGLLEATELLTAAHAIAPRSVPRPMARSLAMITGRGSDCARVHDQAIDVLSAGTQRGELSAVDRAIILLAAAARSVAGDRHEPYYQSDLGTAWVGRFAITGRRRDLENGVAAHERALAEHVPVSEDRAGLLANYSSALLAQFKHDGDLEHLDRAVETARMAVDLAESAAESAAGDLAAGPPSDQGVPGGAGLGSDLGPRIPGPASQRAAAVRLAQLASLSRLRGALLASYEQRGGGDDLDEAVQAAQEAVRLVPTGDPARPRYLASLDYLLSLQAKREAQLDAAGSAELLAARQAQAGGAGSVDLQAARQAQPGAAGSADDSGSPDAGATPGAAPPDEPWHHMMATG